MLIFISGGVRSGKSSFAEVIAGEMANGAHQLHYIATSEPYDAEMIARIKKHQVDRSKGLRQWRTWEQSKQLDRLLNQFTTKDIVLIDCLTTLLGNELFADDCWLDERAVNQLSWRLKETFKEYQQKTKATIIVSNEIFNAGIPDDFGTKIYMKQLGKIHQYLTEIAEKVYLLECGVVRVMKEGP